MLMLHGIMGLTASGRLELRLNNGKLVFNAPLVLTKRKYEPKLLIIRIVVGSQLYLLHVTSPLSDQKTASEVYSERSKIYQELRGRLETQVISLPADDNSLVAVPGNGVFASRKNRVRLCIWAIYAKTAVLIVALTVGLLIGDQLFGKDSPLMLVILLILVGISFAAFPRFIDTFNRNAVAAFDDYPLSPDELQVRPEEVLPAHTRPSRGYGMTAGRAAALILIPFPLYIIVLFMIIGVLVSSL